MNPMHWLLSIFAANLFLASSASADDSARAVLARAIKAHGGSKKVARLRVMRIKAEGIMTPLAGGKGISVIIEDWWQMPDQYKTTSWFEVGGRKVNQTQVINGDKGWVQINDQVMDLPDAALSEMKEQKFAEDLDRLGFLDEKGIELSILEKIHIEGNSAVGVLVKAKGHQDVKMYFNTANGLLVKREHMVLDPATGKRVIQEVVFGGYREIHGMTHYHTLTAYRDGKKFADVKVVEIEFYGKLDPDVFAKP